MIILEKTVLVINITTEMVKNVLEDEMVMITVVYYRNYHSFLVVLIIIVVIYLWGIKL